MTDYRRVVEAVREIKLRRRVVEHRIDTEAVADIQREFNARVYMRLIKTGPILPTPPTLDEMLPDVARVRRDLVECIQFVSVMSEINLIGDFNSDTAFLVLGRSPSCDFAT